MRLPKTPSACRAVIQTSPARHLRGCPLAATGHVSLSCEPRMPKPHLGFLAFGVTYSDNLGHAASIKIMPIWPHCFSSNTSSTAQGGGGSFKNRKPIGEICCCESGMAERSHWWTERCLISLTLSLSFSDYLPTYQPIFYVSIYVSIDLSIDLSIYLPTYLSICLSICLSVYLSIYGAVTFSLM